MKIKFLLILLLLTQLALASSKDIKISIEPIDIVEPDSTFTLKINIENPTTSPIEDIKIKVEEDTPFIIENNEIKISELEPNETKTTYFNIEVEDTEANTYDLEIKYKENNNNYETETIPITIKSKSSDIILSKINTIPEITEQGKKTILELTIVNNGKTNTKNIKAKLDLTFVPFAPITSTEKSILSLNTKEEETITFEIKSLANTESGTYKIPLSITFEDEGGEIKEKQELVSITIGSTPIIDISAETEKPVIIDQPSIFTIKLTNSGLENIKLATLTLKESNNYKIISTNKIYIGEIDSDDYQTAEFTIIPITKTPVNILFTFKDSNNKDFNIEQELDIPIYNLNEAKSLGLISNNTNTIIIVAFIIIIIIALIIYKKRKKKND